MANILVGDWECNFEELYSVFKAYDLKINNNSQLLAQCFKTSKQYQDNLDNDLKRIEIGAAMCMVEILVGWRSSNPTTATLGALLNKFRDLPGWKDVENALRHLVTQKAQTWHDLDDESQSKILNSLVKFQGNEFKLQSLQVLMGIQFESFLEKHINQNVIQQVMQGSSLEMEDLRKGFVMPTGLDENLPKHEIQYFKNELLGTGSGTTEVYRGTFGDIPVAVKIISNYNKHKEALNEIKLLLECKGHPNIVIYHASEMKDNQYFLALELCFEKTLSDWVKDPNCLPVKIEDVEILCQTTEGLAYLHENQIIHRDLKTSNILFSLLKSQIVFVKIADFGISRLLPEGKTSKTVTSYGGSNGWTAAEMLRARQLYNKTGTWTSQKAPKLTKKIDIFSLGCIFYQVLTNGKHPFGSDDTLWDHNIRKGKIQTEENLNCLRQRCNLSLIKRMISKDPAARPDTDYIKAHPIFWSHQKMIDFIQEVSNLAENPPSHHRKQIKKCIDNFEKSYFPQISSAGMPGFGKDWLAKIKDSRFIFHEAFIHRFFYARRSAIRLVRLIRNFSNHFHEEENKELENFVGDFPNGFMKYWLNCFPSLINELRAAFADLKDFDCLKQYY